MDKEILAIKTHYDNGGYHVSESANEAIGILLEYILLDKKRKLNEEYRKYKDQGQ